MKSEKDKYHILSLLIYNLKNKINEETKLKQTYRHREETDGWQRGRETGEKGERIKKYKLVVINRYGDVKYNIGNTVNVVITTYGVR